MVILVILLYLSSRRFLHYDYIELVIIYTHFKLGFNNTNIVRMYPFHTRNYHSIIFPLNI